MPGWSPPRRGFAVFSTAIGRATIAADLRVGLGGPDQPVIAVPVGTSTLAVQAAPASCIPAYGSGDHVRQ
ncbi:hypothetical protein ACFVH0_01490 [Streptomyces sp. NPDC127117]|uniref:hypothetical protein n=1 Tax=Streptomyces sp. NPDC127117 TaxID=3345368 RepID=UPI00362AC3CD